MKPFFKNPALQKAYSENGFVILPFLTPDETLYLLDVFHQNFQPSQINGLYPTHSKNPYDLNMRINAIITEVYKKHVDEILNEYQFFIGHYMVKSHVESKEFELHQDWSVVDESNYAVAQIWCPLVDTGINNGGLFLIPGSHHFYSNYRSGSLFRFHYAVQQKTENYITSVHIPAGYAIFYHNRLIHGSYPNRSNELRIVTMANVADKTAEYLYFQKSKNALGQLDIYRLDREVFLKNMQVFEKGDVPGQLNYLRAVPYSDEEITEADLINKLKHRFR